MNRTNNRLKRVYRDIVAYAREYCSAYGLQEHDAEDLASAAYLKAQARMVGTEVREDADAVINELAWSEVINALESRNNKSELIISEAMRLDQPTEDGDTIEIADDREFDHYGDEIPEWMAMTRKTVDSLRGDERKVVTQLKKPGMSYAMARHEIGLTRPKFYTILKNLKLRFRQCFQAYHQCLAEEFAARFHFPLVYISRDTDAES